MYKLIALALVAAVSCNDLIQGPEGGTKIYDESKEASPAIWKQTCELTIKTNSSDVISRVAITDLRADKDGEAKIIEGGPGQKNVTIELKSPTILRGFDFHVEVYAVKDNEQTDYPEEPLYPEEVPVPREQIPVMENDTQVNRGMKNEEPIKPVIEEGTTTAATKVNNNIKDEVAKPVTEDTTTAAPKVKRQDQLPVTTEKKSTNASVDPNVQNASEKKDTEITGEVKTQKSMALKSYNLVLGTYQQPQDDKTKVKATPSPVEIEKQHPRLSGKDEESNNRVHEVPTTEASTTEFSTTEEHETTEFVTEHYNLEAFRDISKELGERVVFGIKHV